MQCLAINRGPAETPPMLDAITVSPGSAESLKKEFRSPGSKASLTITRIRPMYE
jgi:hypothetical protein